MRSRLSIIAASQPICLSLKRKCSIDFTGPACFRGVLFLSEASTPSPLPANVYIVHFRPIIGRVSFTKHDQACP
jgi:hypothetical protein